MRHDVPVRYGNTQRPKQMGCELPYLQGEPDNQLSTAKPCGAALLRWST
jgi:hypothetical protein